MGDDGIRAVILLKTLIDPLPWIVIIGLIRLWRARPKLPRSSLAAAAAGLTVVYLASVPAVQRRVTVMAQFGCPVDIPAALDYVVVLGAGVSAANVQGVTEPSAETAARLLMGLRVFHDARAKRLVLAGGASRPGRTAEADVMATAATASGVPAEALLLDRRSLNTREHARELVKHPDIKQSRVAIVTSAIHMRRAFSVFRALVPDVVPVPVACEGVSRIGLRSLIPNTAALHEGQQAAYEAVARIWYRMQGAL